AGRRGTLRRRGHPGLGDVSRGRHRPRGRPRRERSGGPVVATDTAKSGGTWTVVRRFLLDNGALTALALLVVVLSLLSGDFPIWAGRRGTLRRRGHPGLGDVSRGRHRPRGRPRRERSGGPVVATDTAKSGGTWTVVRRFLLDNGALTALALLVVVMSLLSGDFLTAQNL